MSKRPDYLTWDEFFMFSAKIASERSKDPNTNVGSVIVNNDKRIISSGYNGFFKGLSDDSGLWGKNNSDSTLDKYHYVVHSEMNSILSSKQDCTGFTMYCTHMPCTECAKIIVQSGIKTIVYANNWGSESEISDFILNEGGVLVKKYNGRRSINMEL